MSGTNRNRPRDKLGLLLGTNWDPSLGQTGLFLFNSTLKSPSCPVCPWDRWGFVPGTIVPQGPPEKCLCVFCLLVFFAPKHFLSGPTYSRSGKCFQDLVSENLPILLRNRPCLELMIVSCDFQVFSSCRKDYWDESESYECQKKRSENYWTHLHKVCLSSRFRILSDRKW